MKRFLLSCILLCALVATAQTPHPPINSPVFRAFNADGAPLSGGMLYTYAAGSSTPLATYSDAGAITPNTNPVVLDSTGSAKIFLAAASYKFVLQDANGVQQWTVDNISGAPPASDVTSVFGRTGAVVAVTGDYSCAQVTGAVCSIPTIYYQTVNAGGADLPQESTLKLVDGTNITTACVDNSGGHSTDCTITANVPAVNVAGTLHDVTSDRSAGSTYTNSNAFAIYVSGYFATGTGTAQLQCFVGTDEVYGNQSGATSNSFPLGFTFIVPAGGTYEVTTSGSTTSVTLAKWFETDLH